jgi:hypothetical protein
MMTGGGDAAQPLYQRSAAIAESLSKADPNSATGRRDLAVSYQEIADLLRGQGHVSGALSFYIRDLSIASQLANSDPERDAWQQDLLSSTVRLADMLMVKPQKR